MTVFAFFGLGTAELAVVAVLGVLLFGKRLPEMSRSFGKMFRGLQKGPERHAGRGVEVKRSFLAEDKPSSPATGPATTAIEPARPPKRVAAAGVKFEEPPVTQAK
ncbi:MAG: twin-arginine translocase TatA/TatE family subunit [Gemmataceae bacterium]